MMMSVTLRLVLRLTILLFCQDLTQTEAGLGLSPVSQLGPAGLGPSYSRNTASAAADNNNVTVPWSFLIVYKVKY